MSTKKEDRKQGLSGADVSEITRFDDRAPLAPGNRARLYLLLSLTFFSLLLSACPLYNPAAFVQHQPTTGATTTATSGGQPQAGPDDIASAATQVTLQWDPPASGAASVVSYSISYRIHGTSAWNPLATVPASSQPEYTILRSVIGAGNFDFAVASVDATGAASPLHPSLAPTADPTTGWFLTWGP